MTAPIYRYNPAVVAQAFATLEAMYPGRAFLGIGSGESLNESPAGMETHFRTKAAHLHTRPERRPPV